MRIYSDVKKGQIFKPLVSYQDHSQQQPCPFHRPTVLPPLRAQAARTCAHWQCSDHLGAQQRRSFLQGSPTQSHQATHTHAIGCADMRRDRGHPRTGSKGKTAGRAGWRGRGGNELFVVTVKHRSHSPSCPGQPHSTAVLELGAKRASSLFFPVRRKEGSTGG